MNTRPFPFLTLVGGGATTTRRPWSLATKTISFALQGHRFSPEEIRVPAGTRFRIEVTNLDATVTAFESADMDFATTISGWDKGSVLVGPLPPGRYEFFDEFHPDQAQGVVVAVEDAD